ncbi:hypothetical protein CKA81_07415 [Pollutimonas thiosulfatoxidans]|uniref:Type IV conjugative transfer system protein TraV n=1 Tax=Pollutimonas thiosulfatoxidans TaxID=2028345 RepID=A0A410GBL9_9BURK|nr:hypothetical protein CKA81_07415 [Pollutimonas thiosulfatoxidans]
MFIQTLSRCGAVLFLAAVISGCSTGSPEAGPSASSRSPGLFNPCTWNRSSCMYEGRYEPGEEAYAEEEARRLNRAAAAKLRRSAN